ncbi:MAG: PEGA domain-containing protein [Deltaproteobacteria bacterium]|nr:PEGA domain-containing protein [Deltaproteobacteria bacterium]
MSRNRLTALATVLALALPAQAFARAAKPEAKKSAGKLSAYNLFGPLSLLGISGLLTQRAVTQARAAGYEVTGADDTEAKVGHDTLKKLKQCDLKPACLQSLSANLGGGKLLAGTLDTDDVHYVIRLVLLDLDSGQLIASAQREILIASRQLEASFDTMLPDLLAGKSSAPTQVTIRSPQKHARGQVDDRPLGELPVTIQLSPGRHEFKAEKANYLPTDRFVEIAPGTTTTVELALTLLPNKVDPDEAVAAVPEVHTAPSPNAPPPPPEPARAGGVPVGSWIALGIGVAAGGAGTYLGLTEKGIASRAVDANHDGVLDITRAEALNGHRDAVVADVCFGAAGVAVLAGAILWLADDGGKPEPTKSVKTASLPDHFAFGVAPIAHGGAASVSVGF